MGDHLSAGLGVPDLHSVVLRPADDARPVRRHSDGIDNVRVACQRAHLHRPPRSYITRELDENFSGNEGHNPNSSILPVKNMLCSKLHCQIVLI